MTKHDRASFPQDALTVCSAWTQQRNAAQLAIPNSTRTPPSADAKAVHFTVQLARTSLTAPAAHQMPSSPPKITSATPSVMPPINITWKRNAHNSVQMELTLITLQFNVRLVMKSVSHALETRLIVLHVTSRLSLRVNVWPHVPLITMLTKDSVRPVLLKLKAASSLWPLKSNRPLKISSLFLLSSLTKKLKLKATPKTSSKSDFQWNQEEDLKTKESFNKVRLIWSMMVWNSKHKFCQMEPWNLNLTLECPWKM